MILQKCVFNQLDKSQFDKNVNHSWLVSVRVAALTMREQLSLILNQYNVWPIPVRYATIDILFKGLNLRDVRLYIIYTLYIYLSIYIYIYVHIIDLVYHIIVSFQC